MIDLSTKTVMPGLIDCHAHILIEANDYQIQHLMQSSAFKVLVSIFDQLGEQCVGTAWTQDSARNAPMRLDVRTHGW